MTDWPVLNNSSIGCALRASCWRPVSALRAIPQSIDGPTFLFLLCSYNYGPSLIEWMHGSAQGLIPRMWNFVHARMRTFWWIQSLNKFLSFIFFSLTGHKYKSLRSHDWPVWREKNKGLRNLFTENVNEIKWPVIRLALKFQLLFCDTRATPFSGLFPLPPHKFTDVCAGGQSERGREKRQRPGTSSTDWLQCSWNRMPVKDDEDVARVTLSLYFLYYSFIWLAYHKKEL